jgi:hypothetical protein
VLNRLLKSRSLCNFFLRKTQICQDFDEWPKGQLATGVNDTVGKFTASVNNIGGNLPLVSTTLAVNLPPVSITMVANSWNNIRLLTPLSELEGKNYLYVNSTTQRCTSKIIKTYLIEDFFYLLPVNCKYLHGFSKKFETALMGYSGAWGKLIHDKT